jgi:hypothetical protein
MVLVQEWLPAELPEAWYAEGSSRRRHVTGEVGQRTPHLADFASLSAGDAMPDAETQCTQTRDVLARQSTKGRVQDPTA